MWERWSLPRRVKQSAGPITTGPSPRHLPERARGRSRTQTRRPGRPGRRSSSRGCRHCAPSSLRPIHFGSCWHPVALLVARRPSRQLVSPCPLEGVRQHLMGLTALAQQKEATSVYQLDDRACPQKHRLRRNAGGTSSSRLSLIAPSGDRGQDLRLVLRSASAGCLVPHCRCSPGTCRTPLLRARLAPRLRAVRGGHRDS